MLKRTAPDIPHFTCPAIDSAILDLQEFAANMDGYFQDGDIHRIPSSVENIVDSIISQLEHLRKANDGLRQAAEWWKEFAEAVEEEKRMMQMDHEYEKTQLEIQHEQAIDSVHEFYVKQANYP